MKVILRCLVLRLRNKSVIFVLIETIIILLFKWHAIFIENLAVLPKDQLVHVWIHVEFDGITVSHHDFVKATL
jgi:hypothetical protein